MLNAEVWFAGNHILGVILSYTPSMPSATVFRIPPMPKARCACGYYYFFKFIFGLSWAFVAVRGLSLVAASGGYSLLWCAGFSLQWLLLLWSTGFRLAGFSSCSIRAQ